MLPQKSLVCAALALVVAGSAFPGAVWAQQPEPEIIRAYRVPHGQAKRFAETLRAIHLAGEFIPTNDGKLVVRGPVDVHIDVARAFAPPTQLGSIARIPLTMLPADRTATTLLAVFGKANSYPNSYAPIIEPCALDNAILAKGTSQQLSQIQAAIFAME